MFLTAEELGVKKIMDKSLDSAISDDVSPTESLSLIDVAIGNHPTAHENEPTVVVNPKNPKNLVAGSHFFEPVPPFKNHCVAFNSFDGGKTWSAPIPMPHLISESFCSDPVLAFAPDGSRVYYAYMDIKFIFTPTPPTYTIDFDIVVSYSDNGGVTWIGPVVALNGKPTIVTFEPFSIEPGFVYDKCWISTHVPIDGGNQSNNNWVYVTATRFDNFPPFNAHIAFTQSRDKGKSWNPPTLLDTTTYPIVVQGSRPTGGKGNDVIVSWYHSGSDGWLAGNFNIRSRYSSNNGTTWNPTVNAAVDAFESPYWLGPEIFYHRWWGTMFPDVEIAPDGTAHIVYTHDPAANPFPGFSNTAEDGDIRYISSSGPPYNSWTSPITLNDDGLVRAQGYAAIETSQLGNDNVVNLHVIFEDHRLSPITETSFPNSPNLFYDIFYTTRYDNGIWSPNRRITDKSSISDYIFIGDYNDVTVNSGLAFGIWTDRRHQSSIFNFEDNVFGSRTPIILSVVSKSPTVDLSSVFSVDIKARESINLAGFQFDLKFNPNVLQVMDVIEGGLLKGKDEKDITTFQRPKLNNSNGLISGIVNVRMSPGGVNITDNLANVKFVAKSKGDSLITLQDIVLSDPAGDNIPHLLENEGKIEITVSISFPWDVNEDGSVNVLDFVIVAQNFQKADFDKRADVNKDGKVDIFDFVIVAQHFGETTSPAAPPMAITLENLSSEQVDALKEMYQIMDKMPNSDPEFLRIKEMLRELIFFAPNQITQTRVLQNYPNPFNPETWIPFELAAEAKVVITIYNASGHIVRTLHLGEKLRGSYVSKDNAAYWDGKNEYGEYVTSGVYFYRLQAGTFSAVKKMILVK